MQERAWLKVSDMFFTRRRDAKVRLETSSLALLARGAAQKATKKEGMPDACTQCADGLGPEIYGELMPGYPPF